MDSALALGSFDSSSICEIILRHMGKQNVTLPIKTQHEMNYVHRSLDIL